MLCLRDRSARKQGPQYPDLNNNDIGGGIVLRGGAFEMKEEPLCRTPPTDLADAARRSPAAGPSRSKACRRRGGGGGGGRAGGARPPIKPLQRHAANARERSRMRVLSKAFSRLKTSLPWVPPDTKLSKLDTLRLASSYISHLKKILDDDTVDSTMVHPLNLTWPFAISSRPILTEGTSEDCDKEARSDTTSDGMSVSP